jgi:DNA repair protein RadC
MIEAVQPAVAELTIVYNNRQKASERTQINSSQDAHRYILTGFNQAVFGIQEEFVAMYLNRANQVLGLYKVGVGGVTGVVFYIRLILGVALKIGAVGLIAAHNHPS